MKLVARFAVLLVALAGVGIASELPKAATSNACGLSAPSQATVGTKLTLIGQLSPKRRRLVELQIRRSGRWVVAARANSSKAGAFRFTLPTSTPGTLNVRAMAPKTRKAAAITCPTVAIELVPIGPSLANSFRAIYALASDQTADPNEVAAIIHDIDVTDDWFATQTNNGVQPRWVRTANPDGTVGEPQVTTVRFAHSAAEYQASSDAFSLAGQDLAAVAPVASSSEKSVVWIDVGNNSAACGQGDGSLSILFEAECVIYPSATSVWQGGATYLLAHEMTHSFGAVPSCAPHFDGTGHVNDDPRDLLYQGPSNQPWQRDWDHLTLDPGHDDYYDTGCTDCYDISLSPFWTMTSSIGS